MQNIRDMQREWAQAMQGRRKCEVCANLESYLQEIPFNIWYNFQFSLLMLILAKTVQICHKLLVIVNFDSSWLKSQP